MGTGHIGNLMMTALVSMVPVLELRGAIPMGVAAGLEFWEALIAAIIGNLIPIPFIILFIRKIFEWLRKKSEGLNRLVERLERKADTKRGLIEKYEFLGLVIIVAIPLPGTGAWTGALVAAMMDMRIKRALPAIAIGVCIAGLIVAYVAFGAKFLFF